MVEGPKELAVEAHFEVGLGALAGGLAFPEANLTPVGGGHLADEQVVEIGLRFEGLGEFDDEGVETDAGFAFEHDGSGETRVGGDFAGGVALALRGYRPAGAGAVLSGCGDLFVGWHFHTSSWAIVLRGRWEAGGAERPKCG